MQAYHIAVWIDHREAKIFSIGAHSSGEDVVHAGHAVPHIHHKAGTMGSGHTGEDVGFLDKVAHDIAAGHEILIFGPAQAKQHLFHRLESRWPEIAKKVVGVQSIDHLRDAELIDFARHFFKKTDRMRPQVE